MFEPKKFNDIFEAMRANTLASGALSDFEVGSVTRTLYESFAWEMAALYEKMNLVYLSAFVDTAQGGQLDQVVAILGIKRGEPEFAHGEVVFERDKTDDALTVPVGTLVSTEDSPENPKKVFQTTENVTFGKGQATVEAPVQALIAGEKQDAAIETITVMPRPLPGVKGVTNRNAILLLGEKQETDDELRRRAKNTLLASGKATTIAIENALLALPGVTDVQLREDFRFAQGRIRVTRKVPGVTGNIEIPAHSKVLLGIGSNPAEYETLDAFTIATGQSEVIVEVRALLEGSAGEDKSTNYATKFVWNFQDPGLNGQVTAVSASALVRTNFGIVRVFVDGPDLTNPQTTDPAEQKRYQEAIGKVRTELDRVRAAGVMAILESARPVLIDLALRIELEAGQNLTASERADLENRARETVLDFFRQTRMEQPLLYSKLLRTLTDIEGVDNLTGLSILTEIIRPGLPTAKQTVNAPFNKIEVDPYERFLPRDVCVASEEKTLLADYEFDLSGSGTAASQEEPVFNGIRTALVAQFPPQSGGEVTLAAQPGGFSPKKITIRTWCARKSLNQSPAPGSKIQLLFFERAALGSLFVYFRKLEIAGGLRLTLAPSLNSDGQAKAITAVRKVITDHLDGLPPETAILLDDLKARILATPSIEDVEINTDDFRLRLSGTLNADAQDHLNTAKKRIDVRRFEKAQIKTGEFLIANGRTNLTVTASTETAGILLKINVFKYIQNPGGTAQTPSDIQQAAIKNTVAAAVNSFFSAAETGKDIAFDDFKNALEGQAAGFSYTLEKCTLTALSADGRSQTISQASPGTLHVRSMELPVMAPITVANITTTVV